VVVRGAETTNDFTTKQMDVSLRESIVKEVLASIDARFEKLQSEIKDIVCSVKLGGEEPMRTEGDQCRKMANQTMAAEVPAAQPSETSSQKSCEPFFVPAVEFSAQAVDVSALSDLERVEPVRREFQAYLGASETVTDPSHFSLKFETCMKNLDSKMMLAIERLTYRIEKLERETLRHDAEFQALVRYAKQEFTNMDTAGREDLKGSKDSQALQHTKQGNGSEQQRSMEIPGAPFAGC